MNGEHAGTRVGSILESWMGKTLEDGWRISWNYGWITLWNMVGAYLGIVDGEHAGNMGGEYLGTMDGDHVGTMDREYLGAIDGEHSGTRLATVLESWTGSILQHAWIISWSHG